MARPIRVEFEGAAYHITARGNERRAIFWDDTDRELFLKTLQQMLEQFGVVLHCYCLMPNHYHLLIQTPRGNLSQAMGWIQGTYTNRFNRRHHRVGHLFQGRYKAHLVDTDAYGQSLVRYIHLNPVRQREKSTPVPAERKKRLAHYPWSSHAFYTGQRDPPAWLNLDWLRYWGRERMAAQKRYREDIRTAFSSANPNPWDGLRGGLVLGSEGMWEKVQTLLQDRKGKHEIRWKEQQGRGQIETRIRSLVEGEADQKLRLWIRVRLGGERLVDVARDEGYRDGSGVFRVVSRLETVAKRDREWSKKLESLKRNLSIVMR